MVIPLSDMQDAHEGRVGVVLGGGPSCPDDLALLSEEHRADAVVFGVNQHGHKLCKVDYIVAIDKLDKFGENLSATAPVVGKQRDADIRITQSPQLPYSGMNAAFVAHVMGCYPIVLCGMGCYSEKRVYFHGEATDNPGKRKGVEHHLRLWRRLRDSIGHWHIRATSGPLLDVFQPYDPAEVDFSEPETDLSLRKPNVKGRLVIMKRPCFVRGERYESQTLVEFDHKTALELVQANRALYYTPEEYEKRGGRKRIRSLGDADRLRGDGEDREQSGDGDSRPAVSKPRRSGTRNRKQRPDVSVPDSGPSDDHAGDDDADGGLD